MTDPVRVVLVDDHALFRDGVKQILQYEDDEFTIVGEVGDGRQAVSMIAATRPDVVLLDVEMPGAHVTDTVRGIRAVSPASRILILSMHEDADLINQLVGLGVSGYLLKTVSRSDLLAAVRSTVLNPQQVILSVSRHVLMTRDRTPADGLSVREREVLGLAADAMSNAQIAARLTISEATVKRHLYNVFGKLGAVSRVDAVNKYYNRPPK
jgi:DNA-binding NarL/FixJ family response regulator